MGYSWKSSILNMLRSKFIYERKLHTSSFCKKCGHTNTIFFKIGVCATCLLRGESYIDRFSFAMHHNDAARCPNSTPCHMSHSQNFDRIDCFLKPVLNIFILRNLIVGWRRGLLMRGLIFCIKSIDLGEVLLVGPR